MKIFLAVSLSILLFAAGTAKGEQSAIYPPEAPLIDLTFPDDWKLEMKSSTLFGHPKDDAGLFVSLAPLEAGSTDPAAAIKEARDLIEQDFKDVTYDEPEKGEAGGAELTIVNAKGVDEDGKANINLVIIGRKDEEALFLLKCISSQEAFENHGEVLSKIISSITSHARRTEAAAIQTYSYPDKENPSYAIDFPGDWKLETTDEGAYVESPDQLVAMNVLLIDMADVDVAVEAMKKKVGAKYESIEWNRGGEPEVVTDEALGVTATFNNGMAVDDKGVKYSVNFAQYTRKGGEKFFLLLSQEPLKALDTHGDAIEKVIRSIKVK